LEPEKQTHLLWGVGQLQCAQVYKPQRVHQVDPVLQDQRSGQPQVLPQMVLQGQQRVLHASTDVLLHGVLRPLLLCQRKAQRQLLDEACPVLRKVLQGHAARARVWRA
jgi:hypothetical protein